VVKVLVGVYPGTFDPITNGHTDIITRASRLVDRLIVGVAVNNDKNPMFSLEDRVALVRAEITPLKGGAQIEVQPFDKLLTQFAADMSAAVIVRGLRAVSDFDIEFQMVGMNARLDPSIDTVFLMASERHQFISSRLVKEIARLGGDVGGFVPANVAEHVARHLAGGEKQAARS
jgi:pantetheine-phosphate adenylyltransferase